MFWFKTLPRGLPDDWQPKIAIFGDMGSKDAISLPFLQRAARSSELDMVIHVGDFAYDLDDVSKVSCLLTNKKRKQYHVICDQQ